MKFLKNTFYRGYNSPTLMSWTNFSVRAVSTLLVLPLVLIKFSTAEIALWYLFSTITIIQTLCDLGFNDTFVRVISFGLAGVKKDELKRMSGEVREKTEPNWDTIEAVWNAMKYVYKRSAVAVFFLYLTIGSYALHKPISALDNPSTGWYSWAVIVISVGFLFYGNVYNIFLMGMNKVALVNRWGTITSLASVLTSFAVLSAGGNIFWLIVSTYAWSGINVLRTYLLSRRVENSVILTFARKVVDKNVVSVIWGSAWRSAIGVTMSNVIIQASGLIFAQIGKTAEVAAYLLAFRILQTINIAALPPFYSKIPAMSRLRAEGNIPELINVSQRGMRITYFTFLLGFIIVGIFAKQLLHLIGSNADFVSPQLWVLMGLGFFIERYGAMHIQLYSTTNHIIWHVANGITGSLYLILSFGLLPYISVYAFPVAMIVSYLAFYSWYSAMHSYRSIKMSPLKFEKNVVVLPAFIFIIYSVFAFFFNIKSIAS